MYLIFCFILAIVLSSSDGSYSSFVASIFILGIGSLYTFRVCKQHRKESLKLFSIVYCVYIILAYILSLNFQHGNFFYSGDSAKYISLYINSHSTYFDFDRLFLFYDTLEGKDILYHETLNYLCGYANIYLGGTTIYYMTLIQTLFGILSSLTLYQIMVKQYEKKAFEYTLVFSMCSYFLLYSCFIVRDIIIAYFFIEAIKIVLDKFKAINFLLLVLLIVLAMGVRFQSGLFLFLILALYVYKATEHSKIRNIAIPMFVVTMIVVVAAVFSSMFFEETIAGVSEHQEETIERQQQIGGLFNMFFKLPVGIREVVIMFFSQIAPFPPFSVLAEAKTTPQVINGLIVIMCEVFWYLIAYSLIVLLFSKYARRKFIQFDYLLLGAAASLILVLTVHPDIRRMIPVYPIIYLSYLKIKNSVPNSQMVKIKGSLVICYVALLMVYVAIKGI